MARCRLGESALGSGCRDVMPEEVGAPTFFRLDLEKQTVHILKSEKPEKAEHFEEVDGAAWTLMVEQNTGRLIGTAATRQVAIVIFGACTEI